MNTIDLVRLAQQGSPVQRLWALVFLFAIRDGATRVWYDRAKGESRLGYEIDGVEYDMVPPPEFIEAELLQAMGKLMRRRSVGRFISRLFGGSAGRTMPLEGAFVVMVGGHGVMVSTTLDLPCARMVLQLSRDASAAPAAHDALESNLRKSPRQSACRNFPKRSRNENALTSLSNNFPQLPNTQFRDSFSHASQRYFVSRATSCPLAVSIFFRAVPGLRGQQWAAIEVASLQKPTAGPRKYRSA